MKESTVPAPTSRRNPLASALIFLVKALVPVAILAAGAGAVYAMMKTAPQPQRAPQQRQARLVDVTMADHTSQRLRVEAAGRVLAAREITLNPQVAGEIVEISSALVPGGHFDAGDLIVRIDPADYELAAKMRQAELTQMEARRVLERANQDVARREYEVLGESLNDEEKSLVLREPQLAAAAADVAAARAMLEDAHLDLQRTTVTAPFDAQVVEKFVDRGTRLTTQTPIVRLVGTDVYWVELAVQQGDLPWIALPEGDAPGSPVVLRQPSVWGPDASREGRVIRLLPALTEQGNMARVLVEVHDPLCLEPENEDKPRMLVGQFLSAEIEGRVLDHVVVLDRAYLRNGDFVWIMDQEDKLDIRPVDIAYRGVERVLIRGGIEDGERIVTTDIAAVAAGMNLRVAGEGEKPGRGGPDGPGGAS
ncbi:MAG: efflux RND transporter periplasmic adaptor subunit [Candidatus Hydrogenedentes bacterium]|nr:efflux RND transporter periplasmic adaptor subunit [Candidatus Hydrogenedentota bacterium]